MGALLDTSVILASLDEDEHGYESCSKRLTAGRPFVYVHALAESYSILTGGRRSLRLSPMAAATLIERSVAPFVRFVSLTPKEVRSALGECERRGVRGGAIYDFLHLSAARKAGARALVTLDVRHFQAIVREGDPPIEGP